jgi:hypothetical protein
MERLWLDEAEMQYPKQWIVAVNAARGEYNKLYAEIYKVVNTHLEALSLMKNLEAEQTWGRVVIKRGFDDTPRIGGILADA